MDKMGLVLKIKTASAVGRWMGCFAVGNETNHEK